MQLKKKYLEQTQGNIIQALPYVFLIAKVDEIDTRTNFIDKKNNWLISSIFQLLIVTDNAECLKFFLLMQNLKGPANNVFIVILTFHVLSSIIF